MYSRRRALSSTLTRDSAVGRLNAAKPARRSDKIGPMSTAADAARALDPVLRAAKPGNHLLGVLVRREYGIEHLRDDAVVDDQGHSL